MHKNVATANFTIVGFEDYIASRQLLLNGTHLPGIALASQAVEKYLKALLVYLDIKIKRVHLNQMEELKKLFDGTVYTEIFDHFDAAFFMLLGNSYKFRYLDDDVINGKSADNIGYLVTHVLFNLDRFIAYMEELLKNERSQYRLAIARNDKRLLEENVILNKGNIQEYFEKQTVLFAIMMDKYGMVSVLIDEYYKPQVYNGRMHLIFLETDYEN